MRAQILAYQGSKMTTTPIEWPDAVPLQENCIVTWDETGRSYRGQVSQVILDFRRGGPPPTLVVRDPKPIAPLS